MTNEHSINSKLAVDRDSKRDTEVPFGNDVIRMNGLRMRSACLVIGPALVVSLMYYFLLGHRRDYLGHFAAGYGGTLSALTIAVAILPTGWYRRISVWIIFPIVIVCIGLGAVTEATVFRLAKFDEIDFCNQNLGAVLAGLAVLHLAGGKKIDDIAVWIGVAVGGCFLLLGFYFALT